LVALTINIAALVVLISSAVRVDQILIRLILVLPILGCLMFAAIQVAAFVMTLRGRDIANPS
jgi:hypothetical protein